MMAGRVAGAGEVPREEEEQPRAVLEEDAGGLEPAVRCRVEDGRPYARWHTVRIRIRARAEQDVQHVGVAALCREVLGRGAVPSAAAQRRTGSEKRGDTASMTSGSGKVQRSAALWGGFGSVGVGFAGEGACKVIVISEACTAPEECL
jgi:hypothetical protein